MKNLVAWAKTFAMSIGGPGLFVVAVIDASVLSLPEVNDILVIWMTLQHRDWMAYYALMATAGSVVGSLSIYYLGRKGGEALLRKRFSADRVDRTLARFRRWGMVTVIVPAILPPPMPFKIFCLAAGATGMTPQAFALATGIGRGVRYLGVGLLAVLFGDVALQYLDRHGAAVAWWLGGFMAVGLLVYYWRRQRHSAAV
jgi:membrane protein YqaA with SNARE-associated domain